MLLFSRQRLQILVLQFVLRLHKAPGNQELEKKNGKGLDGIEYVKQGLNYVGPP